MFIPVLSTLIEEGNNDEGNKESPWRTSVRDEGIAWLICDDRGGLNNNQVKICQVWGKGSQSREEEDHNISTTRKSESSISNNKHSKQYSGGEKHKEEVCDGVWKKEGCHNNDDNDLIVVRKEDNDGPIHGRNKKKRNNCHCPSQCCWRRKTRRMAANPKKARGGGISTTSWQWSHSHNSLCHPLVKVKEQTKINLNQMKV